MSSIDSKPIRVPTPAKDAIRRVAERMSWTDGHAARVLAHIGERASNADLFAVSEQLKADDSSPTAALPPSATG